MEQRNILVMSPHPCDGLAAPATCPAIADRGDAAFGLGEQRVQISLPHVCPLNRPFPQVNYFELNPTETSQAQGTL